jgi:hypothetical protein
MNVYKIWIYDSWGVPARYPSLVRVEQYVGTLAGAEDRVAYLNSQRDTQAYIGEKGMWGELG